VNPFEYLRDVLLRVSTHPASDIDALLPHRWAPVRGVATARQAEIGRPSTDGYFAVPFCTRPDPGEDVVSCFFRSSASPCASWRTFSCKGALLGVVVRKFADAPWA
jgi:hypothetical protein